MDNQHQHIKGYRDLTAQEIALMNFGKSLAEMVGEFIAACEAINAGVVYEPNVAKIESELARQVLAKVVKDMQHAILEGGDRPMLDTRWLAIAKTDLQQGFMSLTRSIAKPTTF